MVCTSGFGNPGGRTAGLPLASFDNKFIGCMHICVINLYFINLSL